MLLRARGFSAQEDRMTTRKFTTAPRGTIEGAAFDLGGFDEAEGVTTRRDRILAAYWDGRQYERGDGEYGRWIKELNGGASGEKLD